MAIQAPPQMHGHNLNAPGPIQNPEALIADMWTNCPALCRAIGPNFDLKDVFHPGLIAQYGEAFLRLVASQIAMHNQTAEMGQLRNEIFEKQKLLDVSIASTQDLQQKLGTQQCELENLRDLLEQQSQSLTNLDARQAGENNLNFEESPAAAKNVTVAPTTPAWTVTATLDRPTHDFYSRSVSLPPLKVSLFPDRVDQQEENHGYGHAETQGPILPFDRSVYEHRAGPPTDRLESVPPTVSTSPIFQPFGSSTKPIVSIGAKKQRAKSPENGGQSGASKRNAPEIERQTSLKDKSMSVGITVMKREGAHESATQAVSQPIEPTKIDAVKQGRAIIPATPLSTKQSKRSPIGKVSAVPSSKPVSYAAAVRTSPTTTSQVEALTMRQTPTPSQNSSPAPDLGFTLEPLPKPTVQQVRSQKQRRPVEAAEKSSNFQSPDSSPFNFADWKQRKIASGTWQDRANISDGQGHQEQRPYRASMHRLRGGWGARPYHNNFGHGNSGPGRFHNGSIFRSRATTEEGYKQEWLAWKAKLVREGRWNPQHAFREAWKNE